MTGAHGPRRGSASHAPTEARRELIVRARPQAVPPWDADAARKLLRETLVAWADVLDVDPVFERDAVTVLVARAAARAASQGHALAESEFAHDWIVVLPESLTDAEFEDAHHELLVRPDLFEWVEPNYAAEEPAALPYDDPDWPAEGHLGGENAWFHALGVDPSVAPGAHVRGTEAWYAWRFPGGDGAGTAFVDVERGWKRDHVCLRPHAIPPPLVGVAGGAHELVDHGTMSLGVVCAADDAQHVIGVVPHVGSVQVASYRRRRRRRLVVRLANTIVRAANALPPGGVMLLEVQLVMPVTLRKTPVEKAQSVFTAIRGATLADVTVVEPAGNNDEEVSSAGLSVDGYDLATELLPGDSGAIVVGAALETVGHERLAASNWGARVDCWAWGNRVATCSVTDTGTDRHRVFDGTSAASAIVAGVALAVQGAYVRDRAGPLPAYLDPSSLRDVLKSFGTQATVPGGGAFERLGVQPDVRRILDEKLQMPFAWVRDSEDDTGEPLAPDASPADASPDMALRAPGAAVGSPPFADDALAAGDPAELHLRVHNRGARAARDLVFDVYWSKPSLGFLPTTWAYLGLVKVASVPEGGWVDDTSLTVGLLPADAWNMSLLSVLRIDPPTAGPPPSPPAYPHVAWSERLRTATRRGVFLLSHALACRRVPELDVDMVPLDMQVLGRAAGKARRAHVRFVLDLPRGGGLVLDVGPDLAAVFGPALRTLYRRADGSALLACAPGRTLELPPFDVPNGAVVPLRLLVAGPAPAAGRTAAVAASLAQEPGPVRRLRWRIAGSVAPVVARPGG